jgi:autophagy-related protein 2
VEVEGVDVRLKVGSKKEEEDTARRKVTTTKQETEVVPSAADLAQSFLDAQPVSEKKQLEEALSAETRDLGASLSASEHSSDDDSEVGTGQMLSLPAFLTEFLQGIVDRTQISIRGVTFQLHVDVPGESGSASTEVVTFQLALESISVEGVTAPVDSEDGAPVLIHKEGKRHISLQNIRAFLISEANVFSTFARSPSMQSSRTSQDAASQQHDTSRASPDLAGHFHSSAMSDTSEQSGGPYPLQDSEDAFNIPYDLPAQENEGDDGESLDSTPRASLYSGSSGGPGSSPRSGSPRPDVPQDTFPWGGRSSSPALRPGSPIPDLDDSELEESFHSSAGRASPYRSRPEDLTQSHLFSHEDAESMYMSAFSTSESVRLRGMPGAWSSSSPEPSPRRRALSPAFSHPRPSPPPLERQPPTPPPVAQSMHLETSGVQAPHIPAESYAQASDIPEHVEEPEDETQQDDVATPRGPTRLVKEVLTLQSISIYVPLNHKHIQVASPELARSVTPNLPGAFSVHAAAVESVQSMAPAPPPAESHTDKSLEISLAPLQVRFDASLGFLLATVVSLLLDATREDSTSKETPNGASANQAAKLPTISVTAESISFLFLDKLAGVADTPERIFANEQLDQNAQVLLKLDMSRLTAKHGRNGDTVDTDITLGTLRLGYANDSILAFDESIQMRQSIVDEMPVGGAEVSIKLKSTPKVTRAEVRTLPLHVKLDLQRLDETFNWFGGLSSFLLMSSSMTSSGASKAGRSPKLPQRARGVRFKEQQPPDRPLSASESKIYSRIGGFRLDLIGKECSVAVDTSAVKLATNDEVIGVHLSRIRLAGPYVRSSRAPAPIVVDLEDTRFDYLNLPNDNDLERLLELITPSKVKFDDDNDEIMVDTLLRQRRKGPVVRAKIDKVNVAVGNLPLLSHLPALGDELARLGSVAKYLPEDDRPGLLSLALVNRLDVSLDVGGKFGLVKSAAQALDVAHISVPSLLAMRLGALTATRNKIEELIGPPADATGLPVLMMRMIGESIEPLIKVKLMGLRLEYRVPTIMDLLGLAEDATPQDFEASLAASVANLGEQAHTVIAGKPAPPSREVSSQSELAQPTTLDIGFLDCLVGLNPQGLASKLFLALTDAHVRTVLPKDSDVSADIRITKASVLLIDDVALLGNGLARPRRRLSKGSSKQVITLCDQGFVDICQIASASATIKVLNNKDAGTQIDVVLRNELLVLETCADSTQTLITLANALKPPTPPSKEIKYRTEIMPVKDLLSSLSADAFGKAEGEYDFDNDFAIAQELGGDEEAESVAEDDSSPLNVDSQYYDDAAVDEELFDAESESLMSVHNTARGEDDQVSIQNLSSQNVSQDDEPLLIQDNYFGQEPLLEGTAHRWNSAKNTYDTSNDEKVQHSPLKVNVRDVHVIWNLYDGYDWNRTREVITKAVQEVEDKANERKARRHRLSGVDQEMSENETVIGDFLFNSIWIDVPANRDPRELANAINQELNGNATESETQSIAATTVTATPSGVAGSLRGRPKRLRLNRSRHHKITFELKGINVDLIAFPPGTGETQSSIDVRIKDLDIFDHVPTSTWKKFVMYDQDAGEREMGTSMVHLEILTVKPLPQLAASEFVIKATVLPLRLHVDQDALDFITRFFEFKDDSVPVHASPSDVPFVQRVEVNSIPVKLDFKPKRVDYAGLRSGHTTEFMNFITLEDSRMVLRHTIIYGVSGFDRLGKTLNDIWMPDIKRTQLPGVLAGLAPVRSLVNVGAGVKDLVVIPLREYRRDGRIARSLGRGAAAFAKTTGTELVKLGAKLAVGTQYALQNAEGLLVRENSLTEPSQASGTGAVGGAQGWTDLDDEADPDAADATEPGTSQRKNISLYADQPMGIVAGMRSAYASLRRDLQMATDAVIAVPGEVMESGSARGAVGAVLRRAPTIVLRPAIGVSKAAGKVLMGGVNSLDREERRRVEAVSFPFLVSKRTRVGCRASPCLAILWSE